MARGSGGRGSVPHGSTAAAAPADVFAGTGLTEFGGSAALETGAFPDPTVEPFQFRRRTKPLEFLCRTKPLEFLRRTKPFEMTRR